MSGTEYGLAEVVEQLFWMSSALRERLDRPGVALVFAEPTEVWSLNEQSKSQLNTPDLAPAHLGTADCRVTFKSESLDMTQSDNLDGHCWHKLFNHCTIAKGYPVPDRKSKRPGLEIPFDMMASLVGADYVQPFGGHLVVKGFSTALFPTSFGDGCMYWHLVHKEDDSRISYADEAICLPPNADSLSHLRIDDIEGARHIVGWSGNITPKIGKHQPETFLGRSITL